ncbi:MAG TPA: hypothetical protein DCR46_07330 [Cytophagales bacterium]|nr:hypothetical protein [Cytophagales bacterium]
MLNILYRISDKGHPKEKLPNATKDHCLQNALDVFGMEGFYVCADNCSSETIQMVRSKGVEPILSTLGNCGSWRFCIEFALQNLNEDSIIYILEDDYLHLKTAKQALIEGINIADYVSLYDHPDKYEDGVNPLVKDGSEACRVCLSKTVHWKETNSTTMTFATRVRIIKEDKKLWWKNTEGKYPNDFKAFQELCKTSFFKKKQKRKLISALPGLATHTELAWLAPLVDWQKV